MATVVCLFVSYVATCIRPLIIIIMHFVLLLTNNQTIIGLATYKIHDCIKVQHLHMIIDRIAKCIIIIILLIASTHSNVKFLISELDKTAEVS